MIKGMDIKKIILKIKEIYLEVVKLFDGLGY